MSNSKVRKLLNRINEPVEKPSYLWWMLCLQVIIWALTAALGAV